jgi:hypothetical protein
VRKARQAARKLQILTGEVCWSLLFALVIPLAGWAQIDPINRQLVQFGYNAALEGHPPQSAYVFYYLNQPQWPATNLTLRLAISPTYLDSELGISGALGANTDVGVGLAGGGFADSYSEIRQGKFLPDESFAGYGAELSLNIYHLFNPGQQIPLYGVLRGFAHYRFYEKNDETAANFQLPDDHLNYGVRTGLRWGGREPTLFPSLAMEISVWYEAQFRSKEGVYGFDDRDLEGQSQLFWGEALLAYTLPESQHSFYLGLTVGTSVTADRLSTYRLGALLPLVSEFPLSLPGYYYQEISATRFAHLGGNYIVPLDARQRWNVNVTAAGAVVQYLNGLQQPGDWHAGVGGGIMYRTASFKMMVGYAYGIEAIRSDGRGANSIGVLMQLDWGQAKTQLFNPAEPSRWRGLERVLGLFGS